MRLPITHRTLLAIALSAATFAIVPIVASAQGANYSVLINGDAAGTATGVANLPADTVIMRQRVDPNMPGEQTMSGRQGNVVVTTADPALIAVVQAWMKADNSGFKDTVQRKSVEIDRVVEGAPTVRFQLTNAWPSWIDSATDSSTVTLVYEKLTIIR